MVINHGEVHDYVGMILDYSKEGAIQVMMINFIRKTLAELPDDMNRVATTPVTEHLFQVNAKPVFLDDNKAEMFHHNVT